MLKQVAGIGIQDEVNCGLVALHLQYGMLRHRLIMPTLLGAVVGMGKLRRKSGRTPRSGKRRPHQEELLQTVH